MQAGFARLDVTPPLHEPLQGYFTERFAKSIMDPLFLNALALREGDETVLLIAADLQCVMTDVCSEIRERVSQRTGVPKEKVLFAVLHIHTSLVLGDWEWTVTTPCTDADYMDLLYRKCCDVAQMAMADLGDATLYLGERETAEPISFVRRYRMKDGTVRCNPGFKHQSEIAHPMGNADNTVRIARFAREGKNDIALVNFATHPDVIGGQRYSADWPGFARRFVEKYFPGVSCVLVNGCQGDVNHIDFLGWKGGLDTREARYAHSEKMGRVIADAVRDEWKTLERAQTGALFAAAEDVFVAYNTQGIERYDEAKALYEGFKNGTAGEKNENGMTLPEAKRIYNMHTRHGTIYRPVPVSVIALGRFALVGIGGEPFTPYMERLRAAFPERLLMTACCANGYAGYLPTKQAFAEGSYEVSNSIFVDSLEDEVVSAAVGLLQSAEEK